MEDQTELNELSSVKNLKAGGLRMVNISEFMNALKLSWLRRVIQSSENVEWYSLSKVDFL